MKVYYMNGAGNDFMVMDARENEDRDFSAMAIALCKLTNAIVHGYRDSMGEITMTVRLLEPNTVEVTVTDRGCGIPDVQQARQPLFTTGGADRSGMGFTIMESFTDGIRVRSAPGKGTTVTMKKRVSRRIGQL